MLDVLMNFFPRFLSGLMVNFQMAIWSIAGGLLLALPLAYVRLAGGFAGKLCDAMVAIFRSAPTFVLVFFLVNVVPSQFSVAGMSMQMTPWLAVVLALVVYGAAYLSDTGIEPLRHLKEGSVVAALLYLMTAVRAFFMMVLSSCFGAAVGVVESVTVTLRAIESLPSVRDRLLLIAVVIAVFTVCFQFIYWGIHKLREMLNARFSPPVPVLIQ
jgi:His/Glu/Gln/Arg/opine family amino acid ABC transporter permease subunit